MESPTNPGSAPSLQNMVLGSVDTLRGHHIPHAVTSGTWNDQPPLLARYDHRRNQWIEETDRLLKGMLRHGIPPPLRCAVQLSNAVQAVHPHQPAAFAHEYRTLAKVRALDFAYESLLRRILDSQGGKQSDNNVAAAISENFDQSAGPSPMSPEYTETWNNMEAPSFGRPPEADITSLISGVTASGQLALKRLLLALESILNVSEYAPLVPVLAALLLTHMSESYTFCTIREMGHASQWFFACSRTEQAAWCCAFGDILRKLHLQTAQYLEDRGVLDVEGLEPLFRDFFVTILPLECALRILDIYTLEGSKVIFRFGVALLVLFKMESAEQLITISNAKEWWSHLRDWTHRRSSKTFNFEIVVRKAYAMHGRAMRKQMRFPRRSILQRIIRMEEDRIRSDERLNENGEYVEPPARPLGLVPPAVPAKGEESVKAILAQPIQSRQHLAQWLPLTLKLTNLNLLFSTNYHGRTLERFYAHLQDVKHSILMCEVLQKASTVDGGEGDTQSHRRTVIGMYASQAWRVSSRVYGDGGCFLFRLEPDAQCWKWSPRHPNNGTQLLDQFDLEEDDDISNDKHTALLEQFMVGTRQYISMGGNPDGSCGLRLNEDLTRGESSIAVGFDNEPLHGTGRGSLFEIGLVEVYGFVRQMDGQAI